MTKQLQRIRRDGQGSVIRLENVPYLFILTQLYLLLLLANIVYFEKFKSKMNHEYLILALVYHYDGP